MPARPIARRSTGGAVVALAAALSALVLAAPRAAVGAWPGDPYAGNVPLSVASGHQQYAAIASDGAGGAIVVWEDARNGNTDLYVQRISASGLALWTADGVPVCTAAGNQIDPRITPDGAGGAVIAWQDGRNAPGDGGDIYAQRVNASGVAQWTANGVVVCNAAASQVQPELVTDATGGAIVAWADWRSGTLSGIYVQRLNSVGGPRWTANGVALRTGASYAELPGLVADGSGGAIVTWADNRGASPALYAQRVNSLGTPQWTANGIDVETGPGYYSGHVAISDDAGGMIVAWTDLIADWDVRAQRLSASGGRLWGYGGALVSGGTGDQHVPRLAPDGSGGAIVAFEDARSGLWQIGAQRISAGGGRLWGASGVALTGHSEGVGSPRLASDGAGGGVVAWIDGRASSQGSLFARRVSGTGEPLWSVDGVLLCAAAGNRQPPVVAADGSGGAILAWPDSRNGSSYDLYAQRVERHGQIGEPAPAIAGVRDVPNDQGGFVRVSWRASDLDTEPGYGIGEYRLYRSVPAAAALAGRAHRPLTEESDVAATGGALLAIASATGTTYWEFVDALQAQAFEGYSVVAATTADSIEGSNPPTLFMVEARAGTSLSSPRWYSAPDSGYSVDNLAPAAPLALTGSFASGTARLSWPPSPEPDFAVYRLHRGTTPAFEPSAANLIATRPDTGYVDPAGAPYHYKLAAVDVHGNVSGFASWSPGGVTGVPFGGGTGLSLAPPAPNPASGPVTFAFSLPHGARVRLAVLDVTGRAARVLTEGTLPAGEHAPTWDLRDEGGRAVPAGVYFARLEADGRTFVRRLAVAR